MKILTIGRINLGVIVSSTCFWDGNSANILKEHVGILL